VSIQKANALFREGKLEESLKAYKKIKYDSPVYDQAQFNIQLVSKKLNKGDGLISFNTTEMVNLDIENCKKNIPEIVDVNPKILKNNTDGSFTDIKEDIFDSKISILNTYFDHIYVVNLKQKIKDRLTISKHLKSYGINFEVFNAINGYEGEAYKTWQKYTQRSLGSFERYKNFKDREIKLGRGLIESPGAIGYIYTYLEILEDAKNKGYERFLILEDDILLDYEFEEKFKNFTRNIDNNWKIILLGASQYGWDGINEKESLEKGYYLPRRIDNCTTCGSFAVAFHESVVDEMITAASSFEAPFDHLPLGELYERHIDKCFVAYPNIVIADVSDSTIRGKRSQDEQSRKVKWRLKNFDYPLDKPSIALIINSERNSKYLNSFSVGKDSPFNLRVYFNTNGGIRPLHNSDLLSKDYNKITDIYNQIDFLDADYILTVDKDEILLEEDFIDYIESKTGIKKIKKNKLIDITDIKKNNNIVKKNRATVIIPTYKRTGNLRNAIQSVILQDYEDIELIVVSDNGKNSELNNEVGHIIDTYNKVSSKCIIKYLIHDFNRNGSAARNTGIIHSTGEYISFLDDDDIYMPGRLSKVIEKLKSSPKGVGAVYCGFLGWNSKENNLGRYAEGDLTECFLSLDYSKHYLHTNTATYRRQAILNLNGFDESYKRHQDLEFNIRFFELYNILTIKEPLVKLKPEPVINSNTLFNSEMIKLKNKFLGQFRYLIKSFPDDVQYKIYSAHVNETLKYIKEKDKAIEYYIDCFDDFDLSLFTKLVVTQNPSLVFKLDDSSNKNRYHKNDIGFYKIIGNNHFESQSHEQVFENLVRIFEEEESFDNVDKYYLLNRIANLKLYNRIKGYLDSKKANYLEIIFDLEEFSKTGYDLKNIPDPSIWFNEFDSWNRLVMNTEIRESKNRYLINNNGARNFAIKHGKKKYKWIMPWDSSCFINKDEFNKLKGSFEQPGNNKYIITPVEIVIDTSFISKDSKITNAIEEPQISFRNDATEVFNEEMVCGDQSKVELLNRLGVENKWDSYTKSNLGEELKFDNSTEAGLFETRGATFKLSSSKVNAITQVNQRNIIRKQAVINCIDNIEINNLQKKISEADFSNRISNNLKGFIADLEIRKIHGQLIWCHGQKEGLDGYSSNIDKIRNQLLLVFNETSKFSSRVYIFTSLFSHSLINDSNNISLNFDDDVRDFIECDFEKVYRRYDTKSLESFQSILSSAFIAQISLLASGKLQESIQLKLEVVVLIYYYATYINTLGHDQDIYNLIYLIDKFYKEIYSYDLMRDLWRIGIDKNKVFI